MTRADDQMLQPVKKNISDQPATFYIRGLSNRKMNEDALLVSRILKGDMQAFKALVQQHQRLVVHMVGRLINDKQDVEDICQEVFLKVYQKLSGFSFQSKLSTWIATIAYRAAVNYLKKKNRMMMDDIEDAGLNTKLNVDADTPERLFERKNLHTFIHQEIEKLPPQYRIVLTLYHLEGMQYAEIEEITGMPAGTVKNYLFRARKMLKDQLMMQLPKEALL
jgi:RNA polymerase sigma-70 factor (ECF subfamily)